MSPYRSASKALADVMERSERRGAAAEHERLLVRAQAHHERAGHAGPEFRACSEPGCVALAAVLEPAPS